MKNKTLLIVLFSLVAISLTACDKLFSPIFGDSSNAGYSYGPAKEESGFLPDPSSDVSTPQASELKANKASYTYSDFIDNNLYAISSTPSVGKAHLLIIPVWFADSDTFITADKKEDVRSDIENSYFGNDADVWRSVKTFYEEESHGVLSISGTVSAWYERSEGYETFAIDKTTAKTCQLVKDATNWYFNNHPSEKRTAYDCDNDGYLDGVMLIYAAPDHKALNNSQYDNLWAYCYWIQEPSNQNPSNPGLNAFFWASYDFMYGKNVVNNRTGKTRYYSGDTSQSRLDTHTFIHEMGHLFGLEDYYDYSNHGYLPAGAFSMQDYNVGGHDPFSSFALGWGKAYVPTSSAVINLKPFTSSGEMILLSPSFNKSNSPFDEYLLLEYYTCDGVNAFDSIYQYMGKYPKGSKEAGIRLWHVDARLLYTRTGDFSANNVTTNPRISSGRVVLMMSNTYNDNKAETKDYLSPLGKDYADYNLLQLIRNDTASSYRPFDTFSSNSLFKAGNSFSMSTYARQFVNSGKLNDKNDLGFTFTVNACNSTYASISINKV